MAIEADAAAATAAGSVSETAPISPPAAEAAAAGPARPRGWLRKLIPRDYHLPRSSRRWRLAAPSAAGASRLASSLSRSLRWKRLPGLSSLTLRSGSAAAVVDAVAFRVMYVVEAVVLGLALSCFFLCCGCHL
jgi:hypothetical protein